LHGPTNSVVSVDWKGWKDIFPQTGRARKYRKSRMEGLKIEEK
jgi:hypothetical protein